MESWVLTIALTCQLMATATLAVPVSLGPEPTPDPSLFKGKCAVSRGVRDVCDMCGTFGLGITTEECCMNVESYDSCKFGFDMLFKMLEEPSSTMKEPSEDETVSALLSLDSLFPVKRYSPLLSPMSWQGYGQQTEPEKRAKVLRNYNRALYQGNKRAGGRGTHHSPSSMWYKG